MTVGSPRERSRPARRGPATLMQVAERADVSLATASRVLNGSGRTVGEPHRSRVLAAAAELDYRANAQAQAIARGATTMVGLLVHDIADPYFAAIAAGVARRAEADSMVVVLATTGRDPERELDYVRLMGSHRARALIVVGSRSDDAEATERLTAELAAFRAAGGAVACVSQDLLGCDTVLAENADGARDLATALHGLGHRRFAVLAGPEGLLTARDRLAGFTAGLRAAGVPESDVEVLHGPFTRDGGHAVAADLARRGSDATCVFAVNDVMAVGAVAAFREAGVDVPGRVSVAGFDDIATLRDLAPSLTTVHLPLERMGELAAQLALEPDPEGAPRVERLRGEVVLRRSTTPPAPR